MKVNNEPQIYFAQEIARLGKHECKFKPRKTDDDSMWWMEQKDLNNRKQEGGEESHGVRHVE